MTSQERVLLALRRKQGDRVPIQDAPWGTTVKRWRREGLPKNQSPSEYFGYEMHACGGDNSLQLEQVVIEDTKDYVVFTDSNGATRRNWKNSTSTPELIGFTITSRSIWEEYRPRMTWNDSRVAWEDQRKAYNQAREQGLFCYLSFYAGFTRICDMVGPERVLIAMVDDPEWVKDMFLTEAQVCVAIAEEMMSRGFDFDAGWISDDLGFKYKGFFSRQVYHELLMPAHKLICDCFKSRGKPMILHSCGYITEFVPHLIEAGFDCLQPLEVKAGNDLIALKKRYGDRLAFMGGIDVRAMADPDPEVIKREISTKVPIAKQGGGYIYHSDHSVPDNVSFEQYCLVMDLIEKHGKF